MVNIEAVGPRVGCGAAIIENGRILLVRRRRQPEAGCWGLPGGKVDLFEPVAKAVAREIREELGITIEPIDLLCVVDQIDQVNGQHWIAPVFRVDRHEGTPSILEPDALSSLEWFDLDGLPAGLTEATKQAVAALQRETV
ncbi:NUDIX domain-containing protein [Aureimonas mangrovi]|uniref:NUDIX domain-containing protein n=1 Tax=Aureimonas mangrovi TaxID=2758041 RepID=UPI00163DDB5D|nr:NUDIX domain-containing protein [Aureimonas mangrovi]